MNEAEPRAEHIDPALKVAGWGVVEGSRTANTGRPLLARPPHLKRHLLDREPLAI